MRPFSTLHFSHQIQQSSAVLTAAHHSKIQHNDDRGLINISSEKLCDYIINTAPHLLNFNAVAALFCKSEKTDIVYQEKAIAYLLMPSHFDSIISKINMLEFKKVILNNMQIPHNTFRLKIYYALFLNKLIPRPVDTDNVISALLSYSVNVLKFIPMLNIFLYEFSEPEINYMFHKLLLVAKSNTNVYTPTALLGLSVIAPRLNFGFHTVIIDDLWSSMKGTFSKNAFKLFVTLFPITSRPNQEKIIYHLTLISVIEWVHIQTQALGALSKLFANGKYPIPDNVFDHILQNIPHNTTKMMSDVLGDLFFVARISYRKRIIKKLLEFLDTHQGPALAATITSLGKIFLAERTPEIWEAILLCNHFEQDNEVQAAIDDVFIRFFSHVSSSEQEKILGAFSYNMDSQSLITLLPFMTESHINLMLNAYFLNNEPFSSYLIGKAANKANEENFKKIIDKMMGYAESIHVNLQLYSAEVLSECFSKLTGTLQTKTVDLLIHLSQNKLMTIRSGSIPCFSMIFESSSETERLKIANFFIAHPNDPLLMSRNLKIRVFPIIFKWTPVEIQQQIMTILLNYLKSNTQCTQPDTILALNAIHKLTNEAGRIQIITALIALFKIKASATCVSALNTMTKTATHDEQKMILEALLPALNTLPTDQSIRNIAFRTALSIMPTLTLDELQHAHDALTSNTHDMTALLFSMRVCESNLLENPSKKRRREPT